MASAVSYRLSKKPSAPKNPLLSVLRSGTIEVFFGGIVPKFRADTSYPMKFTHVYPGGHIGFLVPEDDTRRTDKQYLEAYGNNESLKKLKFPEDKELEIGMMLVIYRNCPVHQTGEMFRGLVEAHDDVLRKVTLYLVDQMETREFSRAELYYITPEYYALPYLSSFGRLEGFEFFKGLSLLDRTIADAVVKNYDSAVKVQYKLNNEEIYDVRVTLPGIDQTFNEMVMNNLIELAAGIFPVEGKSIEATVSHAEPTGEAFVQIQGGLAQHVTDWILDNATDKYESIVKSNESDPKSLNKEIMYMAKFDGDLYRAEILEFVDEQTVTVQYVDFGNFEDVPKHTLVPAGAIHPLLERLPPLCFQIYLKWVKTIVDVDKLIELCETNCEIQVQNALVDVFPVVIIVDKNKKDGDDGYNINKVMIMSKWATKLETEVKKPATKAVPPYKKASC